VVSRTDRLVFTCDGAVTGRLPAQLRLGYRQRDGPRFFPVPGALTLLSIHLSRFTFFLRQEALLYCASPNRGQKSSDLQGQPSSVETVPRLDLWCLRPAMLFQQAALVIEILGASSLRQLGLALGRDPGNVQEGIMPGGAMSPPDQLSETDLGKTRPQALKSAGRRGRRSSSQTKASASELPEGAKQKADDGCTG
jgi:hypothetical protein